jgi:predicted alpha/beta-hydrolase family hydrolase
MSQEQRIPVAAEETSALFEAAVPGPARALFVCAHGAGGHRGDQGMQRLAQALCARGFDLLRFNFLYREKKSRRPDPMPRLKQCMQAVAAHARAELGGKRRLVLGGRSLGGRVASLLAADGFACDALLLLAYPLHPAGKQAELRAVHLPRIGVPVLCLNGTRDALCTRETMEAVLQTARTRWDMHWLEGADHSFRVLKSSGRTEAELYAEIGDAAARWLGTIG